MRRITVLFGAPGVGKGTVGAALSEKWKIPLVSMGDLLREQVKSGTGLGRRADEYMKKGELVPDELVLEAISERINAADAAAGFLLDGFPRNMLQAGMLEKIFVSGDECVVLNFESPDSLLIERLSQRRICGGCGAIYHLTRIPPRRDDVCDRCGAALVQREDDTPEVIAKRLEVFRKTTRPILDYYGKNHRIYSICAQGELSETLVAIEEAGLWR